MADVHVVGLDIAKSVFQLQYRSQSNVAAAPESRLKCAASLPQEG
ncbi:hypothetical protein ABIC35_003939 [Sphingomonas trueperi]